MSQLSPELINAIGKLGVEIVAIISFAIITILLILALLNKNKIGINDKVKDEIQKFLTPTKNE